MDGPKAESLQLAWGSLLSLERLVWRWPMRQGQEGAALVADLVE